MLAWSIASSVCLSFPFISSTNVLAATQIHNLTVGSNPYQGVKALHSFEHLANANPKNENDQINAGIAAYQNNLPHLAIAYYEKAGKIDPHNGLVWNNIGNVYRNSFHQNATAISYYRKAITEQKTYDFAWLNWAFTLNENNQSKQAKVVIQEALSVLPKTDALYVPLKKMLSAPSNQPSQSQALILSVQTKSTLHPHRGITLTAKFSPSVTNVTVIDLTNKNIHRTWDVPHHALQNVFIAGIHAKDHLSIIPYVKGKEVSAGILTVIVQA